MSNGGSICAFAATRIKSSPSTWAGTSYLPFYWLFSLPLGCSTNQSLLYRAFSTINCRLTPKHIIATTTNSLLPRQDWLTKGQDSFQMFVQQHQNISLGPVREISYGDSPLSHCWVWLPRAISSDDPLKPLLGLLISDGFLSVGSFWFCSRVALEAALDEVGSVLATWGGCGLLKFLIPNC